MSDSTGMPGGFLEYDENDQEYYSKIYMQKIKLQYIFMYN